MKIASIQNYTIDSYNNKKQIKFGDTTNVGGYIDKETPKERDIRWLQETKSNRQKNLKYFLENNTISKAEYYKELEELNDWYKNALKEIVSKYAAETESSFEPIKIIKSFFNKIFN